jgi:hypothetical protein
MAYIVARKTGTWEIRESHSTEAGPRSRTLANFRTLTPEVIERARERSVKRLDTDDLRRLARRAGAPVSVPPSDVAAGELLARLAEGRKPRPVLAKLLIDALSGETVRSTDNAQAAAAWIAASPERRGETLRDLLLLADRLPQPRTRKRARFPRFASRPV